MNWQDFIEFLMNEFRVSTYAFEKNANVAAAIISNIKNGVTKRPNRKTIRSIENYLKIVIDDSDPENIQWRRRLKTDDVLEHFAQHHPEVFKLNAFPIVSIVGAGSVTPIDRDTYDYIEFPYPDKNCVALRVVGDSMAPQIENGDLVLIHNTLVPKPEDIVAIRTTGGEQMIKVLISIGPEYVALFSRNPAYPIVNVRVDHIAVILKVVSCIKKFP